jgi:hypothetical protein
MQQTAFYQQNYHDYRGHTPQEDVKLQVNQVNDLIEGGQIERLYNGVDNTLVAHHGHGIVSCYGKGNILHELDYAHSARVGNRRVLLKVQLIGLLALP